jgi:hypothetical protein
MRVMFTIAAVLYVSALTGVFGQQSPTSPKPPSNRFDFEVRADFLPVSLVT